MGGVKNMEDAGGGKAGEIQECHVSDRPRLEQTKPKATHMPLYRRHLTIMKILMEAFHTLT